MEDYLPLSVPRCLRQNFEFWCILIVRKDTTEELAKKVLSKAPNSLIHCMCEVSRNLLLGNVSLTKEEVNNLRKYEKLLTFLSNQRESLDRKRSKLVKYAGQLRTIYASISRLIDDECAATSSSSSGRGETSTSCST